MAGRLGYGEPRIWTQPLRELTRETTRGFEAIEFARDILGIELFPWQKWLLIHALELNVDGTYRFRTVLVLVARQNGKTLVMTLLALWRMFVDAANLVIGTAQNLDVAEEAWSAAVEMAESVPELAAEIQRVDKTNGKKALRLQTGERYKVAAASRRGGRGLSGDLVLLDELREHLSWDAWGAVTKTTLARARAQVFGFSNAGDAASIVLRALRKIALWSDGVAGGDEDRLLEEWADGTQASDLLSEMDELDEADSSLGMFEWSAVPGKPKGDRDEWARANPSLGYTITEGAIAAAMRTDPEWVFRTEVLCQWSSTAAESPFGAGRWEACADPDAQIPLANPLALCIDTSSDRGSTHIAIAGRRADGVAHGEIVARRAGTEWVVQWLRERLDGTLPDKQLDLMGVTLQMNGAPVSSLLDDVRKLCDSPDPNRPGFKVNFVDWTGADLGRATGAAYDLVQGVKSKDVAVAPRLLVTHLDQASLNIAASTAVLKRLGDSFVWDRYKSPADIAPLVAWTGALWLLTNRYEEKKRSRYETSRLVVAGG